MFTFSKNLLVLVVLLVATDAQDVSFCYKCFFEPTGVDYYTCRFPNAGDTPLSSNRVCFVAYNSPTAERVQHIGRFGAECAAPGFPMNHCAYVSTDGFRCQCMGDFCNDTPWPHGVLQKLIDDPNAQNPYPIEKILQVSNATRRFNHKFPKNIKYCKEMPF